jgi:hypothetical protein
LVFGFPHSLSAAFSSAVRGLYSLPTSSICATSAESPAPEADAKNPRVAARTVGKPRRQRFEELPDDVPVLQVHHDQPPGAQRPAVGIAGRHTALRDRDQPLDERPQLLRLRHRRFDAFVAE